MDDQGPEETKEEQTKNEEIKVPVVNEQLYQVVLLQDDAGPSGNTVLPGAVQPSKTIKPCLSKSEHNMHQIITTKDVTNALKSISLGATTQGLKNINLNEFKIPILDSEDPAKYSSTTLIDLKKFMATCFKLNKDTTNSIVLADISNIQNMHAINVNHEVQETTNNNCSEAQTDAPLINIPNEVIVTGTIDAKMSKVGPDKKKTSASVSEKSDLGVAPRDSLSSIGSNVCRICMTRGRER